LSLKSKIKNEAIVLGKALLVTTGYVASGGLYLATKIQIDQIQKMIDVPPGAKYIMIAVPYIILIIGFSGTTKFANDFLRKETKS
jgi:hypothetical protein